MEIVQVLTIDTSESVKNIEELKAEIESLDKLASDKSLELSERAGFAEKAAELRKELKGVDEEVNSIATSTGKVEGKTKKVGIGFKSISNSILTATGLGEDLNSMFGEISSTIGGAGKAQAAWNAVQQIFTTIMNGNTIAVKLFRAALISTGIGAIVVLVGTLIASFSLLKDNLNGNSTALRDWARDLIDSLPFGEEVLNLIDRFNTELGGLTGAWNAFKGAISSTFETIGTLIIQFLDGEFSAMIDTIVNAPAEAAKAAQQGIVDTLNEIENEAIRERAGKRIKELERQKNLLEANGQDLVAIERSILETRAATFKVGSEEYKDAINDLAAFELRTVRESKEKAEEIRKEELEKRKEDLQLINDAILESNQIRLEQLQNLQAEIERIEEESFQEKLSKEELEILRVQDQFFNLITQAEANGLEFETLVEEQSRREQEIRDRYSKERLEKELKEAERSFQIERNAIAQKTSLIGSGFRTFGELARSFAGESERGQRRAFQFQKIANIATATIDTITSAQKAYLSQLTIPTPDALIRAKAAAAIATLAGVARVTAIARTQFGGGQSSISTIEPSGNVPAPSFENPVQEQSETTSGLNGLDLGFLNGDESEVSDLFSDEDSTKSVFKAYVVNDEVANGLEAKQTVEEIASLSE